MRTFTFQHTLHGQHLSAKENGTKLMQISSAYIHGLIFKQPCYLHTAEESLTLRLMNSTYMKMKDYIPFTNVIT